MVLGKVFQVLFFQLFPLSPVNILNREGILCSLINISEKSQGSFFFFSGQHLDIKTASKVALLAQIILIR